MDTTLMTFHVNTSLHTQSLHLIGSWDNFSKHYPMERDIRRSSRQWRGCYKFEDIICDGDESTSTKRSGGLKMGSTYYYYYELDDGTEIHDASLPFTTACPYLPGQPLNLLSVPVEVQPPRSRSASMTSIASDDIMTMNPADKFMAPRAPPPPPTLSRLRTAPSQLLKKRSARSLSPSMSSPSSPWSAKSFFGLRSAAAPSALDLDKRGRSSSLAKLGVESKSNRPSVAERPVGRKERSVPRDVSPQSLVRTLSREPSPLRHFVAQEPGPYTTTILTIPDEIEEEEAEDDDNFASDMNRLSFLERSILTPLAPPPTALRFPTSGTSTPRDTERDIGKPLPLLPEQLQFELMPQPLKLRSSAFADDLIDLAANAPRSHFSTSTIGSNWRFSTSSHGSSSSADDGEDSPLEQSLCEGYRLPEAEEPKTANRATFGGSAPFTPSAAVHEGNLSALQELLSEMGYLGGAISGK